MNTAVVTGFETFGKYIVNPTKWLALSADGKEIAGHKIHSLVFPSIVRFPVATDNSGTILVNKAIKTHADVIISFGLASAIKGFRIERSATNWSYNEKYLSPQDNNRRLDPIRPEKEQLQNDLKKWDFGIMEELFKKENIPFDSEISNDPGQYSCNALIYRTELAIQEKNLSIPNLFVHVACTEEAIEFIPDFDRKNKVLIKKEDTLKALEIILRSYLK